MSNIDPATRADVAGNIRRYYLFSFVGSLQLWISIWVLYLQQERGLSLTQITLLDGPFWLVMVLSEVPTGALADRWGKRRILLLGAFSMAGGIFLFGAASNYPLLLISYLFWAFSMTLTSGADSAFVFETLTSLGRAGEFRRVLGRAQALTTLGFLVGSLLGAPLANAAGLTTPIFVSAAICLGAAFIVLTFREPERQQPAEPVPYLRIMGEAARFTWQHAGLRWAMLLRAILFTADMWGVIFIQPFLASHDVPVAQYGFLQAALRVLAIGGALVAYRLAFHYGERRLILALAAGFVGALLVLASVPSMIAFAAFGLLGLCRAVAMPTFTDYVNRHAPEHLRATVASLAQVIVSIMIVTTEPLLGIVADRSSLRAAFLLGATIVVVIGGGAMIAWLRADRALPAGRRSEVLAVVSE